MNTGQRLANETAGSLRADGRYVLRLYIIGTTPQSMRAVANIRRICETHLQDRYELDVIDVSQRPALAEGEQIVATPTLIKMLPLPLRRFIGDLSQTDRILLGLDLIEALTAKFKSGLRGNKREPFTFC
jgi:circadian clock protein KaiB